MRLMITLSVFLHLLLGFAVTFSVAAEDEPSDNLVKQSSIGIDEILFAPSSFVTATEDDFMLSAYLRTTMKEGEVPTDIGEISDTAERFLVLRLGRWGVTFGWLGEKTARLLEPRTLAVDYKIPLLDEEGRTAFAMDFKYATRKPPKYSLRRSLLDFGVFSITGIASKTVASIFEPYGGVMMNYAYVDAAAAELTDLWKLVPFVGIKINIGFRNAQIVSELNRGRADRSEDPMLTWYFGASVGF